MRVISIALLALILSASAATAEPYLNICTFDLFPCVYDSHNSKVGIPLGSVEELIRPINGKWYIMGWCADAFSRFTRAVECAMLGLWLRQYV